MMWHPMLRTTSLAIGIVALAIVLGTVYVDMQNTSPGALSAVHAQHADLAGPQNCRLCHGRAGQSMGSACLSCHENIGAQLAAGKGFHGQMTADRKTDCARCHSEHHGQDFRITNRRSFALAGVSDPQLFRHDALEFHLTGKHLSVGCEKCHLLAHVALLPMGAKRFVGLSQNCTSCHQDTHHGSYGADCSSCHGQQEPFPRVAKFEHTPAFALIGAHGKAACADCHLPNSQGSVATLIAARSVEGAGSAAVRTCGACHESPHNEPFLATVARNLNLHFGDSCRYCHKAVYESFVGHRTMLDSRLHAWTGFALDAPHEGLACSACHRGFGRAKPLDGFRQSYPGRHSDDCQACHGDPHQGQFDPGPSERTDCLTCHQRHMFSPSTFTMVRHKETRFPLLGAHVNVACNGCHVMAQVSKPQQLRHGDAAGRVAPVTLGPSTSSGFVRTESSQLRIFRGTPTSCKACHDDPHGGQFERGPFRAGDCRVCHDERSFGPSTFTVEQHGQTRFALTGAHAAVACDACHKPSGKALVVRRTAPSALDLSAVTPTAKQPLRKRVVALGRDRRMGVDETVQRHLFQGTPKQCKACHVDVHKGRFDQPHLPPRVAGKTGCSRCHTTQSFRQIRAADFDHTLWTGFKLRGAHRRAECIDCHAPTRATASHAATFGRAAGHNCQSCHSDPHVGQFGPTATVNCTQCHVEESSFRELVFDHQRHSRFPLDRDHVNLACSACHKAQPLGNGSTAIRYKPLGIKCADCHVPRGPRRTHSLP